MKGFGIVFGVLAIVLEAFGARADDAPCHHRKHQNNHAERVRSSTPGHENAGWSGRPRRACGSFIVSGFIMVG